MRIFKTKVFAKIAKSAGLTDKTLAQAAKEVEKGLVDAELSGNLYKNRVPLPGRGKRGGARTILVYSKSPGRTVYLFGFPKNVKDNLISKKLATYRKLEQLHSAFTEGQIKDLIQSKELEEIYDVDTKKESGKQTKRGR